MERTKRTKLQLSWWAQMTLDHFQLNYQTTSCHVSLTTAASAVRRKTLGVIRILVLTRRPAHAGRRARPVLAAALGVECVLSRGGRGGRHREDNDLGQHRERLNEWKRLPETVTNDKVTSVGDVDRRERTGRAALLDLTPNTKTCC